MAFRAEVEGDPAAEAQDTWVVEWLIGLKMKLKRQRVSSVLPEHHEVFNRMLGKDPPPRPAPSNPILEQQRNKSSHDYTFPVENNSLLVGALSVPGGLSTDKGYRGHVNDAIKDTGDT